MSTRRRLAEHRGGLSLVALVLASIVAMGCAEAEAPAPESVSTESLDGPSEVVAPQTVADLFPDAPGKALVLDNCSACHAVACSVIGQRPAARWTSLREDHRDKASSLSEEDLDTIFAYLSSRFNDAEPEPRVPPHFLEQGCTPF